MKSKFGKYMERGTLNSRNHFDLYFILLLCLDDDNVGSELIIAAITMANNIKM